MMERFALKQSQLCGSWEMKERLGMGGFGHVYLYQHLESGEKMAVKLCRLELNSKNKERWSREIQIMKKLKHGNVVQAREVPEELTSISLNDLPLLAMEYCSRGDLRKLLNKPENCCGLKESEVFSLLSDIGSGVQYLHDNKIIHRDIKPENIVLQEVDGKLVHKLIDLGYAKDLDQGSLCTSFVGTIQYLAPELFENKPYTVTVDYWSFGTVIFECICGFRPFLHHMQPVQWTSKVKNKGPKDIMATEDMNGEVRFSAHLHYPNNLSRPLLEPVESLLQMLLLWDPAARGGTVDADTNKPYCNTALQNILNLKVIHVLDMTSAQLHSLILGAEENLQSLHLRLEAQTQSHIPPLSQELLLETGVSLDPRRPPSQCLPDGLQGCDSCIVFLFDKSLNKYSGPLTARPLPDSVNFIVRETKTQLPLTALRKVWGEAVSYICGLKEDYIRLYRGQRAAILSLLRYNTNLTRYKNLLFSHSQQLQAKLAFFKTSIQQDLEQYSKQRQTGISSEKLLKTWQENQEKADEFMKVADVAHLDEEIVAVHFEIVELQRSPFARRQVDVMEQLEEKAIELYKQLKAKCKSPDPPHGYSDSSDMLKVILQMVQNQDRVVKDLYTHLSTILVCKRRIVDLFPKLETAVTDIKNAEAGVVQMQMKRQKEFWFLLKIACAHTGSPSQSLTQQSCDGESVHQLLEENENYLSQLTSLLQETTRDPEYSIMEQDWSWTQCESIGDQT
ncbi:inhibitor of nuclear factor kappa-B kinase subunit alpha-like isoform X1 [Takifugu rubripes]|uniref:Inhibitor of nuclear factor kappa-B kinase subunit alpha n=1 Tax=Takifugu rubripes TaxID=31033 RepID=H2UHB6_TAKRU|nr:inhibitor of nuclear factor kappa-B kinase subunit alpha-like isoform X1 [Takifugu rubripes]XP_011601696.1 inhibitor of nuclear factor kappa-B kinase subunit alpha-like isoform X1 [Takifugu rubripes]XP_056903265.1 inhibitor of nuclear factor kappa-B kinase subunit alpha-like isoform X1 [Takifugu flavidus]XP_056903266.1 inhibitor of nuclear factor kappa-B kinase subunit alpha-like isoform X1 [Takifugu flavidus]|eukprot:XP_011601695.1 PREDICTED: inhibitor of nuclear factor kappa-B kinase subunit alpha-like isoform X1 [Takifugu rubripes]